MDLYIGSDSSINWAHKYLFIKGKLGLCLRSDTSVNRAACLPFVSSVNRVHIYLLTKVQTGHMFDSSLNRAYVYSLNFCEFCRVSLIFDIDISLHYPI